MVPTLGAVVSHLGTLPSRSPVCSLDSRWPCGHAPGAIRRFYRRRDCRLLRRCRCCCLLWPPTATLQHGCHHRYRQAGHCLRRAPCTPQCRTPRAALVSPLAPARVTILPGEIPTGQSNQVDHVPALEARTTVRLIYQTTLYVEPPTRM